MKEYKVLYTKESLKFLKKIDNSTARVIYSWVIKIQKVAKIQEHMEKPYQIIEKENVDIVLEIIGYYVLLLLLGIEVKSTKGKSCE